MPICQSVVPKQLLALVLTMFAVAPGQIPASLIGRWKVGLPYDTPGASGLNAKQEKFIRTLRIVYFSEHLQVCGKRVPVEPVETKSLTIDEFVETYGFIPRLIGIRSSAITDVTLNSTSGMYSCSDYEDPGVHVLIGRDGHVVMEIANAYFPLKKQ